MIHIVIYRDSAENIQGFLVEGHAGYADHGRDIVCAGVSAIAQTALLGLNDVANIKPAYEINDGWLKCTVPSNISAADREKANIILKTMLQGFRSIQLKYRKFLSIEEREVS